jgi:hypothetical protein
MATLQKQEILLFFPILQMSGNFRTLLNFSVSYRRENSFYFQLQ